MNGNLSSNSIKNFVRNNIFKKERFVNIQRNVRRTSPVITTYVQEPVRRVSRIYEEPMRRANRIYEEPIRRVSRIYEEPVTTQVNVERVYE